jgi:hypothetical protein
MEDTKVLFRCFSYFFCPATRHGGAWGEKSYSSFSFMTSALDGGEWSASRPGRALPPRERTTGTHCRGGCVGPRAGLDTEAGGKILSPLPGIEPRSPGHPTRSQTLRFSVNAKVNYHCVTHMNLRTGWSINLCGYKT